MGPVPPMDGIFAESNLYTTSNNPVDDLAQGIEATGLDPSFGTLHSTPGEASSQRSLHVTTLNPQSEVESFDHHYKVHRTRYFVAGRVFKTLWSEPRGVDSTGAATATTNIITDSEFTERPGEIQKVRRFVIINPMDGHCLCLAINTYNEQGVNKKGVHADHHTIIYSERSPTYLPGESAKLNKQPLHMKPDSKRHKLHPASRLNYAKIYTVEYNIKVWFIGTLSSESLGQMYSDYDIVHPPMTTRTTTVAPQQSMTLRYTTNYATGGTVGRANDAPSYGLTPEVDPLAYSSQKSYLLSHSTGGIQYSPRSNTSNSPQSRMAPSNSAASSSNLDGGKYTDVDEDTARRGSFQPPPYSYPQTSNFSGHGGTAPGIREWEDEMEPPGNSRQYARNMTTDSYATGSSATASYTNYYDATPYHAAESSSANQYTTCDDPAKDGEDSGEEREE